MAEAYGLIDEAMLPVLADQVPLEWAGDIYCIVLHHCHRLADLPRMRAWTQSMQRWCNDFAGSANYGGVCDVHRLQVQAASDDYRMLEERLAAASSALEESTPGRQGRATTNSARCAGVAAMPTARSRRSRGHGRWRGAPARRGAAALCPR